jgi:hypothetical protein
VQVQQKEKIGEGAHGVLYRGIWKSLRVAIKTIEFQGPEGSEAISDYANTAQICVHTHLITTWQCFVRPLSRLPRLPTHACRCRGCRGEKQTTYVTPERVLQRKEGETRRDGVQSEVLELYHEFCEGGNLASAVEAGFFLRRDGCTHTNHVLQVAWGMVVALHYLYSRGIVHGMPCCHAALCSTGTAVLLYVACTPCSAAVAAASSFASSAAAPAISARPASQGNAMVSSARRQWAPAGVTGSCVLQACRGVGSQQRGQPFACVHTTPARAR